MVKTKKAGNLLRGYPAFVNPDATRDSEAGWVRIEDRVLELRFDATAHKTQIGRSGGFPLLALPFWESVGH